MQLRNREEQLPAPKKGEMCARLHAVSLWELRFTLFINIPIIIKITRSYPIKNNLSGGMAMSPPSGASKKKSARPYHPFLKATWAIFDPL